ncbi:hypothetical protein [Sphingobacterium sp. UBA5670]|uniref:hypothetical protein n=1 Tax=Sphingobacterium sp. UBA5670 TaxID=1947502 RepID=UPI0025F6D652|nr:hypothetical protein [Sphingobacterium sp. UBA5670]
MGAYSVYGGVKVGWENVSQISSNVNVGFDIPYASGIRGQLIQVVIKLDKISNNRIDLDISPIAGDAIQGEDFTLSDSHLVFEPGENSKTLTVHLKGISEFDELIAFKIVNSSNAKVGPRNLFVVNIAN